MTVSILDKIQKRRCYPVLLEGGETLHVRSLGGWDKLDMAALESVDDQLAYALGRCLVHENGERVFERLPDESVSAFVARVRLLTEDLSYADLAALSDAISKVTKTPSVETIGKNSEPTAAAAS